MDASALEVEAPPSRHSGARDDLLAQVRRRNSDRAFADGQLPLWPEPVRGVPNGLLRSALFGAIKRGKRRFLERAAIPCVGGVTITYTGLRLDQSDLDVWEGALHLARSVKLGNRVEFTERAFLRLIGRGGPNGRQLGKSDRDWLRKVLARLTATAVEVAHGPYAYCGSLIAEYFRDDTIGRYVVVLNPRIKALFNHDSWTGIDWSIRRSLVGHPLAQWLHGFYSTHAAPLPYRAETLHRLCGSEAGETASSDADRHKAMLDWKEDSLVPALAALERVSAAAGQSFAWQIEGDNLVRVSRSPTTSQYRHLRSRASCRSG